MFTYLQNKEFCRIYTTIVFQLSMIPHLHHVSRKKQFTLLTKIKSFVVFKMNEGQVVVISFDEEDEVIITKNPELEESVVANRDVFFSRKSVPGDGHCIVNCFSTFFGKATSEVLNVLWQEFHNNVEEYMKFGEYENSEQLLQCLQQYIFDKNCDHGTMDLVLEASSKVYMHRIFLFENSIDDPSCGVIGEKFTKYINLIKRGDHYNLVVSREKRKIVGAR